MEQVIEGGSLLSSIVAMFFKGIDKIFDSAAQYEEEMGVLKQVTRIPLQDENGKETPYTLTIKLAPIKGKPGKFYVEAQTTAPGLDVTSINEKVLTLNSSTKDDFLKLIDNLLSKQDLVRTSEKKDNEESSDKSEQQQSTNPKQEAEIAELIQSAATADGIEYRTVEMEDGHLAAIRTTLQQRAAIPTVCDLTISAEDPFEQKPIKSIKDKSVMVSAVTKKGDILDFDTFCQRINTEIDKYLNDNKLKEKSSRPANSSSQVDATFVKSNGEVSFVAINASCNIRAALDLIETAGQNDDFIASLPEDAEQSYRIVDQGDDTLDIVEIEAVDTSVTYDVIFKAVNDMVARLTAIKWAIGTVKWSEETPLCTTYWTCSSLLDCCAEWVVRHTEHYPCILNPFIDSPTFDCYKIDGKLSVDLIRTDMINNYLQELVLLLDNYYVNLECDEQQRVADALEELKRILTHAQ